MSAEPREARSLETDLEFRTAGNGVAIALAGYAARFNSPSEPIGGHFVETIEPGAFARSLKAGTNVRLDVDHNPEKLLASTAAGTLKLTEDGIGLLAVGDLAPTSYARDLKTLADRGEIRSMSFEFKVPKGGERWSDGATRRTLSEVRLFSVSILTGRPPAYPQTTAQIRSLAEAIRADPDDLTRAIACLTDGTPLTPASHALLEAALARSLSSNPAAGLLALRLRSLALEDKLSRPVKLRRAD
jgi:HK97 family phage prohead protease